MLPWPLKPSVGLGGRGVPSLSLPGGGHGLGSLLLAKMMGTLPEGFGPAVSGCLCVGCMDEWRDG